MAQVRQIGIFGGGPAGLSAALWLKNLGFEPWIVEARERLGGMQNFNFLANAWVLGQAGLTGPEVAARYVAHAAQTGIRSICAATPTSVERGQDGFHVRLTGVGGHTRQEECSALLVATGTRYRADEVLHGVSGFTTIPTERIAYGPYAFADLGACAGLRILIVGGGDNAFENARLLAGTAAMSHMVLRSPPRAQQGLRSAIAAYEMAGICRTYRNTRIADLALSGNAITAVLADDFGTVQIEVDRIHVLAGYEPNTSFLRDVFGPAATGFTFDDGRYLKVDAAGRTGVPGVYAAGDVCDPAFPSVVGAVAQGARAAKAIEMDLRTP